MNITRRSCLLLAAAAACRPALGAAAKADRGKPPAIDDWIVINTLGGLGDPNEPASANPGDEAPVITARMIADAHRSGVTAVNQTIGYVFGKGDPFTQTVRAINEWNKVIASHPDDLLKVLNTADIHRAKTQKKLGIIYGFQNAAMLGDKAVRVDFFAELGVRIIQLTYNPANALGGGSMDPAGTGLTPFGHEVVERLNAQRVIVDLSHSGRQTCLDAARASRRPIAITHTGCRALIDLPRNKTDEELKLVASRGGYVGIYFMPFLAKGRNATVEDVVNHVEHAVSVCGEDHVGIGTDGPFSGIDDMERYQQHLAEEHAQRKAAGIAAPGEAPGIMPFAVGLIGPEQMRTLTQALHSRGHTPRRIEKILGGNFLRYAREVWGA
jgi:membrane dipeptidase